MKLLKESCNLVISEISFSWYGWRLNQRISFFKDEVEIYYRVTYFSKLHEFNVTSRGGGK